MNSGKLTDGNWLPSSIYPQTTVTGIHNYPPGGTKPQPDLKADWNVLV